MDPRTLYLVGFGLGLVGSLVTVASLVLAGLVANGVLALGATVTFVIGLVSAYRREPFDLTPTLAYRVGNWGSAVFVVGLGLLMLAVGVVSLGTFG